MKMSGGEGRKRYIDMVHNCIEQCLKLYMSKKEAACTLLIEKNIKPQVTEIVWQRLEDQNQEFFRAYYLKLAVKEQIVKFNKLLAEQVEVMQRTGLVGVPSMPMRNGSYLPTVQQVHRAGENHGCVMGSNGMHTSMGTNAFTYRGPSINSCMQSSLGIPVHNRGEDIPSNMVLPHSTNMGIRPMLNGGVVKREADSATSPFNYAAPSNFVRPHSAMTDASMSSFSGVDSGLQPPNGSMLDTDAFLFGCLGQLSQNFSVQNLIFDAASHTDILDGYPDPPFVPWNSNNFLYPQGNIGRFG